MFKKAQKMSLFIILGLFIFLLFSLLFYSQSSAVRQVDIENPESLQMFVESCIKETTEEALQKLGKRGSIIERNNFIGNDHVFVFSKDDYLKKEEAEKQLAGEISKNLPECLSRSDDQSLRFGSQQPLITALIKNEEIILDAGYHIELLQEGRSTAFDKFSTTVPINLGIILEKVQRIFEQGPGLEDNNDKIPLKIIYINPQATLVRLEDPGHTIRNKVFYYAFGMK